MRITFIIQAAINFVIITVGCSIWKKHTPVYLSVQACVFLRLL